MRARMARNFEDQICIIRESAKFLCAAKYRTIMRYRLRFGDAFAAQKYQMCVIGEGAAKFCGPQLQVSNTRSFAWPITTVSNMRYRLKFGDAFAAQKYQICVIGESAAKVCDPQLQP